MLFFGGIPNYGPVFPFLRRHFPEHRQAVLYHAPKLDPALRILVFEWRKMAAIRQVPLVCGGHERPVVALKFSGVTEDGSYLISASKGIIFSATTIIYLSLLNAEFIPLKYFYHITVKSSVWWTSSMHIGEFLSLLIFCLSYIVLLGLYIVSYWKTKSFVR